MYFKQLKAHFCTWGGGTFSFLSFLETPALDLLDLPPEQPWCGTTPSLGGGETAKTTKKKTAKKPQKTH